MKTPVYVLGPNGSFSSYGAQLFLANQHFSAVEFVFCKSFSEIFQSVQENPKSLAIVPVQNMSTSSVHENIDLFFQHPELQIFSEFMLPIHLDVLALENTQWENITDIYSHPKAIEQCRKFLQNFNGKIHYCSSTAKAAEIITKSQSMHKAVIGNHQILNTNQLKSLQNNIHDNPKNETQFVVFGQKNAQPQWAEAGKKWTVHFECKNETGSLSEILKIISNHGGNLLKIESRPIPSQQGRFRFWLDIDTTNANENLLTALNTNTIQFSCLGKYKIGKTIDDQSPQAKLNICRQKIDIIDEKIILLLAQRHEAVSKISAQKKALNLSVKQPNRWNNIVEKNKKLALQHQVSPQLIHDVYETIHQHSILHQKTKS